MREILFRGKTTKNRWVEGAYFKHDTVKVCFSSDDPKPRHLIIQDGFCDWGFEPPIHCVEVGPSTIGQYTGLTDKNGKKIFEGDIAKNEYEDRKCQYFKIFYNEKTLQWEVMNKYGMRGNLHNVIESMEAIGNIHDNPELLGGET